MLLTWNNKKSILLLIFLEIISRFWQYKVHQLRNSLTVCDVSAKMSFMDQAMLLCSKVLAAIRVPGCSNTTVMSVLVVSATDGHKTRDSCLHFKTDGITCFIKNATWKHRQNHMLLLPSPVTDRKKRLCVYRHALDATNNWPSLSGSANLWIACKANGDALGCWEWKQNPLPHWRQLLCHSLQRWFFRLVSSDCLCPAQHHWPPPCWFKQPSQSKMSQQLSIISGENWKNNECRFTFFDLTKK